MNKHITFILVFILPIFCLMTCTENAQEEKSGMSNLTSSIEILQSWQGDFPVKYFELFSNEQREQALGFIDDEITFTNIWKHFKPGQDIPEINFQDNFILFARNTKFYNRISIGQVKVKDGVAEILAMETMSAIPIEDHVALSLVLIKRQGINAIRVGNETISIN